MKIKRALPWIPIIILPFIIWEPILILVLLGLILVGSIATPILIGALALFSGLVLFSYDDKEEDLPWIFKWVPGYIDFAENFFENITI